MTFVVDWALNNNYLSGLCTLNKNGIYHTFEIVLCVLSLQHETLCQIYDKLSNSSVYSYILFKCKKEFPDVLKVSGKAGKSQNHFYKYFILYTLL